MKSYTVEHAARDARRTEFYNKIAAVFGICLVLYLVAFHPMDILLTIENIFR